MITWSSASLAMKAICSGDSRMLSVCSTAPIDGTAMYAVRCSALFHMKVATRWSPVMPMRRNAFANRAACSPDLPIGRVPVPVTGCRGHRAVAVHDRTRIA